MDQPVLTYTCDICGQENISSGDMPVHISINHLDDVQCVFCSHVCKTVEQLQWHIDRVHPDNNYDGKVGNCCYGGEAFSDGLDFGVEEFCTPRESRGGKRNISNSSNDTNHFDKQKAKQQRSDESKKKNDVEQQLQDYQLNKHLNFLQQQNNNTPLLKINCPICGYEPRNDEDELSLQVHVNNHFDSSTHMINDDEDDAVQQSQQHLPQQHNRPRKQQHHRQHQLHWGVQLPNFLTSASSVNNESIPEKFKDDLKSCTPNVISKILQVLGLSWSSTSSSSAAAAKSPSSSFSSLKLCADLSHFSTQQMPDQGYGCGYRNLQMILSCLANNQHFQQVIFQGTPIIPSIHRLQMLLETSWREGFDKEGGRQLSNSVLSTRKWIGATDIVALLSFLKIRCQLYDFSRPVPPPSSIKHPDLIKLVYDYYYNSTNNRNKNDLNDGCCNMKPPLYIQHQGHSRLVIGCIKKVDCSNKGNKKIDGFFQNGVNAATTTTAAATAAATSNTAATSKNSSSGSSNFKCEDYNLLILDPGLPKYKLDQVFKVMRREGGGSNASDAEKCLKLFIKGPESFSDRQYQVARVMGLFESEEMWMASKKLTSIKMS
ncbi:hypothetical protein HELRODRAFT_192824 [Helobdella robusta]|uniref:C2H2-type domain-containing protein n=1 Tax=Helobdella robusta TaxID=6412 RepID=T1FUC2_HELRO|nr:hypothetical protein HELRODRAFT_192824 [Helobdella robusta]ESN99861.1 hypothetical protein HELRODRAFT_192824 [Helobdella robusta]